MTEQAILLCGHGSRKKEGVEGLKELTEKMQKRYNDTLVRYGFLELSQPSYYDAIKDLYDKGIRDIVALPVFLFPGIHLNYEIPGEMNKYQQEMDGLRIRMAPHIGICDQLIDLAEKRIIEAEKTYFKDHIDPGNDLLLVTGVGASITEANADIAKATRLIWEKTGFGFAEYAFISRMTFPSVTEVLQMIKHLPFQRLVVFPMLLFPGVYLDKIFMAIEDFKTQTQKEIAFAEPFGIDEILIDILESRINQAN